MYPPCALAYAAVMMTPTTKPPPACSSPRPSTAHSIAGMLSLLGEPPRSREVWSWFLPADLRATEAEQRELVLADLRNVGRDVERLGELSELDAVHHVGEPRSLEEEH